MLLSDTLKNEFALYAKSRIPKEACGIIIETTNSHIIFPCENIADSDDDFQIAPNNYMNAQHFGKIVGVVHSHVFGPAKMSDVDIAASEAHKLPYYMVDLADHTWVEYIPSKFRGPLIGREWVHGVNDCYTLIQDYYKHHLKINLPDVYRSPMWWENGGNLYGENFDAYGFRVVSDLREHDVLLIQVGSSTPNHGAIFLGNTNIMHHFYKHLSNIELYDGVWRKNTKIILRYKSL